MRIFYSIAVLLVLYVISYFFIYNIGSYTSHSVSPHTVVRQIVDGKMRDVWVYKQEIDRISVRGWWREYVMTDRQYIDIAYYPLIKINLKVINEPPPTKLYVDDVGEVVFMR